MEGFQLQEDGVLSFVKEERYHAIFFRGIDGVTLGGEWGRLSLDSATLGNAYFSVYTLALDYKEVGIGSGQRDLDEILTDPSIGVPEKISLLKKLGAKRNVDLNDILLYDLGGRFFYFAIEAEGEGEVHFRDLAVDSTGDNFMDTFPQIYRKRNSFFHRYISIYSSIYNDFQREIDRLPDLLDLDTCPEELLIVYGSWMGIDLKGGFLSEDVLRNLVKEAYELNKMKGTKHAVERIVQIMLGTEATVVEHNSIRAWMKTQDPSKVSPVFQEGGIYDVTILVDTGITEETRHQLLYILNQFKPIRTQIDIVQMDENITVDSNTFLDVNTRIPEAHQGKLDETASLDGVVALS